MSPQLLKARGPSLANDTVALISRHGTGVIPGTTPRTVAPGQVLNFFCVGFVFVSVRTEECDWCFSFKLRWHKTTGQIVVMCKLLVGSISARESMCFSCSLEKHGCAFLKGGGSRCPFEGGLDFPMRAWWSVLAPWHVWMDAFHRGYGHFVIFHNKKKKAHRVKSTLSWFCDWIFVESPEVRYYVDEKTTLKSRTIRRHGPHHLI